jgi:hypothetical protein
MRRTLILAATTVSVVLGACLIFAWNKSNENIVVITSTPPIGHGILAAVRIPGAEWNTQLKEFRVRNPSVHLGYGDITRSDGPDHQIHALGVYVDTQRWGTLGESAIVGPPEFWFCASYAPGALPGNVSDDLRLYGARMLFKSNWDDIPSDAETAHRHYVQNDYQRVLQYLVYSQGLPVDYAKYSEIFVGERNWHSLGAMINERYRYYRWCSPDSTAIFPPCEPAVEIIYDTKKRAGVIFYMTHALFWYVLSAPQTPRENLLLAYLEQQLDQLPGPTPVFNPPGPYDAEKPKWFTF